VLKDATSTAGLVAQVAETAAHIHMAQEAQEGVVGVVGVDAQGAQETVGGFWASVASSGVQVCNMYHNNGHNYTKYIH
jgi:hypothetical protein